MNSLFSFLAALTCAAAAPISSDETSTTFRLKSRVLSPPNPSFDNLYLEPYHIYPGANYAVLSSTNATNGIIGYLNGTAADFADENTDLLFNDNPSPYRFIIDSVNATYNPILINAGTGPRASSLIRVSSNTIIRSLGDSMVSRDCPCRRLRNHRLTVLACNNTLQYGPAVQLFYEPKVISTPAGCSDVELMAESVE